MKLDAERNGLLDSSAPWVVAQAFAGAGKTSLAIELTRRYRLDPGLKPGQRILFISFSNASCVRATESLRAARIPDSEADVATFHSFALAILRRYCRRRELCGPIATDPKQDAGTYLTFAEIIEHATALLDDELASLIADIFPLVIVDEYQDTSEDLLGFLRAAFEGRSTIRCFGDAHQRIQPGAAAFDCIETSEQLGAQVVRIAPLRGYCRYADFNLAYLAKSFRDKTEFRGNRESIQWVAVPSTNEQLAHALVWDLLRARDAYRTAAVITFSNATAGKVSALLARTTEKRPRRVYATTVRPRALVAARRNLHLAILRSWVDHDNALLEVSEAAALLAVAGDGSHKHREKRQQLIAKTLSKTPPPALSAPAWAGASHELDDVAMEALGAAAGSIADLVQQRWTSMSWAAAATGRDWTGLAHLVPTGLRLGQPGWDATLARAWDVDVRFRASTTRTTVLTVNQAKNRQFDEVIVIVDAFDRVRGPITDLNAMQMYVAVSRARHRVKVVVVENGNTKRSKLLDRVWLHSA